MNGNQENDTERATVRCGALFSTSRIFRNCFESPARLAVLLLLLATARAEEILGYTEPFKTINMSSAEQGVIAEMLVEEGARVKKSQVVARLDTATLLAEL